MFSFLFNPFFILPMILVAWAQMRVRSRLQKVQPSGFGRAAFGR